MVSWVDKSPDRGTGDTTQLPCGAVRTCLSDPHEGEVIHE